MQSFDVLFIWFSLSYVKRSIFDSSSNGVYTIHHNAGGEYMHTLKRTQMYFPEDILRELKRKANEEKTTVTHIVREAVSELLKKEKAKNWAEDSLWDMVGSSSSKDRDLSVNHDKYLYGKNK